MHGSMLNPGLGMKQGYDSAMYGAYGPAFDPALNVALGVSAEKPLALAADSSLISSISIEKAGNRPQLKSAAILTVLAAPPPEGSFRPPYIGADKTITHNAAKLRFDRLPRLPRVPHAPDIARVAARFERPWLEHVLSWSGRYAHPAENMPDYGRDMALTIGDAALSLLLDYTDEEKRTLLVRLVQYGLDLHAIARAGGTWDDLGGHMHGRKLPILLAGLVLDDEAMLSIGRTMPGRFQEDRQTFYVAGSDVGRRLHQADGRPREVYRAEDVGVAEWGEQHTRQSRSLGLRERWNHPALFDYIDRYWTVEAGRSAAGGDNIRPFHRALWEAYRGREPAAP
jgi:hypothetical protein